MAFTYNTTTISNEQPEQASLHEQVPLLLHNSVSYIAAYKLCKKRAASIYSKTDEHAALYTI